MNRHTLAAVTAVGLLAPLVPLGTASAADDPGPGPIVGGALTQETAVSANPVKDGPVVDLGKGRQTYIVQLDQPAVPARATATTKDGQTYAKAPAERTYRNELVAAQKDVRSDIAGIVGGTPQVSASWTEALNGFAVTLTREQALEVSRLDGISAVQVEQIHQLTTDVGPEWIGAPKIWDGSAVPGDAGTKGEGVVVGIIDSGINPANPSFAASVPASEGGDGYVVTNPRTKYYGRCDPAHAQYKADWGCNDKLIGAYNFTTDNSLYDLGGHGTHTASTTAGNQVEVTTYAGKGTPFEFSTTETIKGVAPHANIIAYDVCIDGCSGSAIVSAINQAIIDDVDAINYSIGSTSSSSPWAQADTLAFLNARAAGIHVATSAGNAGAGAATIGSPGDSPWMTTVGATQHDRQWQATVTDITDGSGATHPDVKGVGFSKATDQAYPVVDGAALGSKLCLKPELEAAGVDLTGKIIICERGTSGRVEKGEVVAALGAQGMILANDAASGDSLNADPHVLPAVHITHAAAQELRTWLTGRTGVTLELSGGTKHRGADVADIMAAFSSRGPNRAVSIISPSLSAPGVDILAADGSDNEVSWGFMSGTSMASPHTAGSLALLAGAHPDWTPAQAQSALMSTAVRAIKDNDGTAADPHDMGSGRVDLTKAAMAGLVFDVTEAQYRAADPARGGDVRTLNLASMADNDCLGACSWTRTATATSTGPGTWTATVEATTPGLSLSVDKSSFTLAAGESADVKVTASVGNAEKKWMYGTLVLTPPAGSKAPVAHLPIAVLPSSAVLPDGVDITTRRDAGSQASGDLRMAVDSDKVSFDAAGLVPMTDHSVSAKLDPTNSDPYDNLDAVHVERIQVPAGAKRLVLRLANTTAPDFDLYVGRGEVSAANEVCMSAVGGSAESCDIADPEAGEWWVLVQNWQASSPGATDTADLGVAVVSGKAHGLRVEGPSTVAGAGDPFTVRTFWDDEALKAGDELYGAVDVVAAGASAGVIPLTLHRVEDDVVRTTDNPKPAPGAVVTHTVTVAPNVTPEDLAFTIRDTIPAGATYVDGSATNGATYANGAVTFTGTQPTVVGKQGSYTWTTSATDPACINPILGSAGYADLESEYGLLAEEGVEGEDAWRGYSSRTFGLYGESVQGLTVTDDALMLGGFDDYATSTGPQSLPDTTAPNNLAAALWQDMVIQYDEATNKGLTLAGNSTFVVAEFDDVHRKGAPNETYDVEIVRRNNSSDVWFAYDNLNGPLSQVTIGAENATGTSGQALVNKADAASQISNGTVVCGTYGDASTPELEFSYQVQIPDTAHERQRLAGEFSHSVDNPGARTVTEKTLLTVGGAKERTGTALSLDPTRIEVDKTTVATATVFSAGETPATGQVQFLAGTRVAGTGTLDAQGRATATLSGFATAGVQAITARYLGDGANLASTSAPVNLVVEQASTPIPKVKPTVKVKTPKKVRVGAKPGKVVVTVTAPKVTPTGTVKVVIKGAGKKVSRTFTIDVRGRATITLPKYRKAGKVRVSVTYSGDEAVLSGSAKAQFKVVRR